MQTQVTGRIPNDLIGEYITAGKATVILKSKALQAHYSFNITKARKQSNSSAIIFWVSYHTTEMVYVGYLLQGQERLSFKFKPKHEINVLESDAPIRALQYLLDCLNQKIVPDKLEVLHDGNCGRCGRQLKDPKALALGFGKECWDHIKHLFIWSQG